MTRDHDCEAIITVNMTATRQPRVQTDFDQHDLQQLVEMAAD